MKLCTIIHFLHPIVNINKFSNFNSARYNFSSTLILPSRSARGENHPKGTIIKTFLSLHTIFFIIARREPSEICAKRPLLPFSLLPRSTHKKINLGKLWFQDHFIGSLRARFVMLIRFLGATKHKKFPKKLCHNLPAVLRRSAKI